MAVLLSCAIAGVLPGTAAADVERIAFDGASAGAQFDSFDGCARSMALVMPMDGRTKESRTGVTRDTSLLIQLVRFDFCSFRQSFLFGHVDLAQRDFRVRGDLGYALLRGRVSVLDWMTGQPVPVDLDLTWNAVGTPLSEQERSHERSPDGSMEIYRGVGRVRAAAATGTIREGDLEYAGGQSLSANLSSTKAGQVTLLR